MAERKYYLGIIKPVREDFMTNFTEEDEQIMGEHFQYLKGLLNKGKLVLAGPVTNEKKPMGIFIFECESIEEARKLFENDPSVKTGIQKIISLEPFRLSLYRSLNR